MTPDAMYGIGESGICHPIKHTKFYKLRNGEASITTTTTIIQYKKILLSDFWLKGHPNIFFESQSQFTRHNYKLNNVLCVLSDEALSSLRKWLR